VINNDVEEGDYPEDSTVQTSQHFDRDILKWFEKFGNFFQGSPIVM
jgi:hypothetical protein